ncbi:MAG: hypothetical protein ABI382_09015 [Nakamurella sp.]
MTSSSSDAAAERFNTVKRGYAPAEVSAYIDRLQRSLQSAEQERAASTNRITEISGTLDSVKSDLSATRSELNNSRADVDTLREDLDRATSQPLTMSRLSARMQRLFEIAEEESADIRTSADRYSSETRNNAEIEAAQQRRVAESEAAKLQADTAAELAALRSESESEISSAQAEIEANRVELEQTRAAIYEQAKRLMAEAHTSAEKTIAEARERSEHMSATATSDRAKQEEDYELAIEARRRQAHRAIGEAEQTSRADAAHRIDQANTHARNIIESANAHVEDMLRRTASESHQRVAEADEAVRKLVSLRSELQQQILDLSGRLGDLSDTMTTVRKTLEPLALENQRPSLDAFPVDPASIKSKTPNVLSATAPQWHPPAPPVSLSWEKVSAQLENNTSGQPSSSSAETDSAVDDISALADLTNTTGVAAADRSMTNAQS